MPEFKIVSVGGSIIIPKTGFDYSFLKKFKKVIKEIVSHGDNLILIVGGGITTRVYQNALQKVGKYSPEDLDWMGIAGTKINAELVRFLFKEVAYEKVVSNPTKKVKTTRKLIVSSGWKPGWSTDYVAVLFAKTYGAKELINLSNITYVYDKDPNQYPEAKIIKEVGWGEFRKNISGDVWVAGANVPFDPIASKEAEKLGLTVKILQGTNLFQVKKALGGKKFKGTTIH